MSKPLLNRDISWLSFQTRVYDEAFKPRTRLGDKILYHGIVASNMDEFYRVRYPAIVQETPDELDEIICSVEKHWNIWTEGFKSFNNKYHLITKVANLNKKDSKWAENYFQQCLFPTLVPVTVDKARKPTIRSGMYVMTVTEDDGKESLGYIEIPQGLERFIPIPGKQSVILVEDLIQNNLKHLIRDRKIIRSCPFAILRSAEIYLRTDEQTDPYSLIKETLQEREKSWITYLEMAPCPEKTQKYVTKLVNPETGTIVAKNQMIRISDLKKFPMELLKEDDRPKKLIPRVTLPPDVNIFNYISKSDRLFFHPYESYDASTVRFLEESAKDPDVLSIRISLYRVSDHSRIIQALLKAADTGKLVTVLVELKARFDEKHNMEIANILREGGVRIVYTKPNIKTHAKLCLVTRRERGTITIYSQIGTGNYNESNSRVYTDYSYFTADHKMGEDLVRFFNLLTSDQGDFKSRKIIYAPYNLKDTIISGIEEQIQRVKKKKKDGRIVLKCNAVTDTGIARKLIDAACAGVKVVLIVRSACIIQPQKNLTIYSIVGQQLEHSRIMVFGSGKNSKVYIGSSDMMTRNLSRRNELMILVEPKDLKARVLKHIEMYLRDTCNRRKILENYRYVDVKPEKNHKPYDCHIEFAKEAKALQQ